MDIKVGTTFKKRGKHNKDRVYTVIDTLTTINNLGKVVRVEYKCAYPFIGQQVTSVERATTIKMGIL
tara:strand:+ start:331 stop:531 length:201 start_codon:yes stop_codon:yes gene_type:complete